MRDNFTYEEIMFRHLYIRYDLFYLKTLVDVYHMFIWGSWSALWVENGFNFSRLRGVAKGVGLDGGKSVNGGFRRNPDGAVGTEANEEVARVLLLHLFGLTAKYFWSQSGNFPKTAVEVCEIIVTALESDLGDVFIALSELAADFGDAQFIQIMLKDAADTRLEPATEGGG